ncbi:MAG: methyltransferase [Pseudomonadota bacterium]
MRIEYHRTLIADHVRNQAIYDALKAQIAPGETSVADIGAGTGLIGLMAAKLGAREVFLYESEPVGAVAEEVLRANRAKGCTVFPFSSLDIDDPPQVDLVVSETLGNYAFEENMIETLNDAAARHLKPGGALLPSCVRQYVAPVIAPRLYDELSVWDNVGFGLDLSLAKEMSLNNVYVRAFKPDELFQPEGTVWDTVTFRAGPAKNSTKRKGDAEWTVQNDVTVYGLAYWWAAEFGTTSIIGTSPGDRQTHWEQLYFPCAKPMQIMGGEGIRALITSSSSFDAGTHLAWSVARTNGSGKVLERQKMDLDRGYLP